MGYEEGRNLVWELRFTDGTLDRLSHLADELVRLKVDVILARASSGALAAKRATTSIPIVFLAVYGPVEVGLGPSLAHPGGNITGVAVNASDLARLVEAIAASRLPAVYPARPYVEAGGLMSYGSDVSELWRRGPLYVDKILKGAKPGDLPVEQPNAFELVINMRTAKAMRLTIPPSLALRATAIVE